MKYVPFAATGETVSQMCLGTMMFGSRTDRSESDRIPGAALNGWAPLVCNQLPYNLLERGIKVKVLPQALAENIAITTYRAFVIGLLAGKYAAAQPLPANTRGENDPRVPIWLAKYGDGIEKLGKFSAERGVPMGHVATAWVYSKQGVTSPIVGVSTLAQTLTAIDGFDLELTPAEITEIESYFDTAIKMEAGGKFPERRQQLDLIAE